MSIRSSLTPACPERIRIAETGIGPCEDSISIGPATTDVSSAPLSRWYWAETCRAISRTPSVPVVTGFQVDHVSLFVVELESRVAKTTTSPTAAPTIAARIRYAMANLPRETDGSGFGRAR